MVVVVPFANILLVVCFLNWNMLCLRERERERGYNPFSSNFAVDILRLHVWLCCCFHSFRCGGVGWVVVCLDHNIDHHHHRSFDGRQCFFFCWGFEPRIVPCSKPKLWPGGNLCKLLFNVALSTDILLMKDIHIGIQYKVYVCMQVHATCMFER